MIFKPIPCRTRWEGLAASLWIVLIDLLLVVWAVRRPADTLKFILIVLVAASVPLLVQLLYRTWSAFTLEYWVDRNGIIVRWANVREAIPLPSVLRIVQGRDLEVGRPGFLDWPAPHLRLAPVTGYANLIMCATRPPGECLFLETETGVYAISPEEPEMFLAVVQERYRMGPAQALQAQRIRHLWFDSVLPTDRTGVWLLGVGFLGVLVLYGVLMISFPNLPDVLTVRYNSAGLPEEIREKTALFRLPAIGLLAWVANGVFGLWLLASHQRTGAYILWGGAIVVQVFTLLALMSLIT